MSSVKLNVTGPVSLEIFSICEIILKYLVSLEFFTPLLKEADSMLIQPVFLTAVLNKGECYTFLWGE